MKLTNLATRPDKFIDTMELIERSFNYSEQNSFKEDFYPLVEKGNLENCWVLLSENDKVVAHSGCMRRNISILNKDIEILLIGGVAVDENHRGQGHSSTLLRHILEEHSDLAFQVLWSEKIEMYRKLGFIPCVGLYELSKTDSKSSFKKVCFEELSQSELKDIKKLYKQSKEHRLARSDNDWKNIASIKSTELFIKKNNEGIANYFFINKGQDLTGIIHEYGDLSDLNEMRAHGKVWSPVQKRESISLFGCLAKIGNETDFKEAIALLSDSRVEVESVGEEIKFKFQETTFSLGHEDFLQGILGPNRFEELADLPPIFISGLDSI